MSSLPLCYCRLHSDNLDFFGFTGGIPRPGGTLSQLDSQALLTYDNLTKIGSYNDPDMLTICNGGQSDAEYRAQLSVGHFYVCFSLRITRTGAGPTEKKAENNNVVFGLPR